MHAFQEGLRYNLLTKFDQHISDMTAITVKIKQFSEPVSL